jgi:DHA1 family bicyclomycin/chloramphenicol resistance-like MFS transporter
MLRPDTFALTALLALLTALGPVSTDMYLPSLPEIGRLLGASIAHVQLTISVYLAFFAVGQIVYGPVSDRLGRKPVLMGSLILYSAASLGCAAAATIELLIAARAMQALGGAGVIVVARAIVRDLYEGPRAGRELSMMGTIMGIAPIVAPVVGGLMQTVFGWRANFALALAFGLIACAIVWRKLPETLRQRAEMPLSLVGMLRTYGVFARSRVFLAHLALVTLSYAGLFAWLSGASFVLQDLYGLTAFEFGFAFAGGSLGYVLGTTLATRLVVRYGLDRVIGLGSLALALGGLAMVAGVVLQWSWAFAMVLPIALYLTGLGLTLPQGIAGALSPFAERAGAASSVLGFVQQTFAALLGVALGHLLGDSAWPLAAAIAAMGCLTILVWALTRAARTAKLAK